MYVGCEVVVVCDCGLWYRVMFVHSHTGAGKKQHTKHT